MDFLDVVKWMVADAKADELRLTAVLANALYRDAGMVVMDTTKMDTANLKPGRVFKAPPMDNVNTMLEAIHQGAAVVKEAKADLFERKKKPSAQKGKPKGPNPNIHYKGIKLKVFEALQQTTGKVSSIELSDILELKRVQVSGALNSLFEDKVVRREPSKHVNDKGKTSAIFLYWMAP